LRGCSNPTSAAGSATPLAGLNWIFVDREARLDAVAPSCRDLTGSRNRLLHRSCVFTFEGQSACVNWSQWTSPAAALEDYNHLGAPSQKTRADDSVVLVWAPSTEGAHCDDLYYKTAAMVRGKTWGVTAYADDGALASRVLARFGQFRLTRDWVGVKVG
jgi:hypothetical protein